MVTNEYDIFEEEVYCLNQQEYVDEKVLEGTPMVNEKIIELVDTGAKQENHLIVEVDETGDDEDTDKILLIYPFYCSDIDILERCTENLSELCPQNTDITPST